MESVLSPKKTVLINEKPHPQVRHQKSNLWDAVLNISH